MCQTALVCKIVSMTFLAKHLFPTIKNINASKIAEYYSVINIQTHGKWDARKHH